MIHVLESTFFLGKEHFEEALTAMKAVDRSLISEHAFIGWNDTDDGLSNTHERLARWGLEHYIGHEPSLQMALQLASSVEQFLGLLDIDVSYDEQGNIDGLDFSTCKYWQRYTWKCLEGIAPFVEPFSFIAAKLEGPTYYRWTFFKQGLIEEEGHRRTEIVWGTKRLFDVNVP